MIQKFLFVVVIVTVVVVPVSLIRSFVPLQLTMVEGYVVQQPSTSISSSINVKVKQGIAMPIDFVRSIPQVRRSVPTTTTNSRMLMFAVAENDTSDIDCIEQNHVIVMKKQSSIINDSNNMVRSTNSRLHRRITTTKAISMGMMILSITGFVLFPTSVLAIESITTSLVQSSSSWYSSFTSTGFYQAFSLVFLSELGDKTFFIAGLLAMKTNRIISLIGSLSALIVMTILSVIIGQIFHVLPTFGGSIIDGVPLDDIAAAIAFAFFGIKILKEALEMDDSSSSMMDEEFAEAEETVKDNENKVVLNQNRIGQIVSIFGLVFAAEFGDRSFVSTIALSAAQNPFSVAGGAIAAHAVATGIAVAGGSVVAKYLSEKVIGLIGGTLFLVFAATTVLGIF